MTTNKYAEFKTNEIDANQERSYGKYKGPYVSLLVDKCMKWSHASYGGIRYWRRSPLYNVCTLTIFKTLWELAFYNGKNRQHNFLAWKWPHPIPLPSLEVFLKIHQNLGTEPSLTWRWCFCGWSFVFGFNVIVQDWVREREGAIISLALISATVSL